MPGVGCGSCARWLTGMLTRKAPTLSRRTKIEEMAAMRPLIFSGRTGRKAKTAMRP